MARPSHAAEETRREEKILTTGSIEDDGESHDATEDAKSHHEFAHRLSECTLVRPVVRLSPDPADIHAWQYRLQQRIPQIDSKRTFQYIKEIVAFGTRPMGSENHKRVENYITSHLKGDQVEDDAFTADTVEGKFPVRNIIAKYPGTKDGIIVILGHYDTNYPLRNIGFVGANDGGSSTAILLEYANYLRGKKRDGYSVWLVWTDGEEAVRQWSEADSLYGTRHLAEKWEKDGTLKKIKALLVMDMIGDADLNIERETNAPSWLSDLVYQAAERGGVQSHFYARSAAVEDDHLPFVKRGVPSIDVIDLDYGYNNVFHHTAQDTIDKLSPRSLEIVGNTILEAIRMLDRR